MILDNFTQVFFHHRRLLVSPTQVQQNLVKQLQQPEYLVVQQQLQRRTRNLV